jgi:DNA-binding NarL/FixJ family response regulator
VTGEGWDAAYEKFPREITLGIQWLSNPVMWSYTTFHTETAQQPLRSPRDDERILRVVIVEGDGGVRRALRRWIDSQTDVACVAAYSSAADALRRASPGRKELWLLNRALPDGPGSQCLERLRRLTPELAGVIYSIYEDSNELFLATPGGALAYHMKRTPPERMLEPLRAGEAAAFSSNEILARVRRYFQGALALAPGSEGAAELDNLTPREHEILRLLSKGHVDKEIAARLGISGWTVHGHVKHIFEKLNVHTRTEAVVKFLQK